MSYGTNPLSHRVHLQYEQAGTHVRSAGNKILADGAGIRFMGSEPVTDGRYVHMVKPISIAIGQVAIPEGTVQSLLMEVFRLEE